MLWAQDLLLGDHGLNSSSYLVSLLVPHHFPLPTRKKIKEMESLFFFFFFVRVSWDSAFAKNLFYVICSIRKECLCP